LDRLIVPFVCNHKNVSQKLCERDKNNVKNIIIAAVYIIYLFIQCSTWAGWMHNLTAFDFLNDAHFELYLNLNF